MTRFHKSILLVAVSIMALPVLVRATDSDSDFESKLNDIRDRREQFLKIRSEALDTRTKTLEQRQTLSQERATQRKDVLLHIIDVQIAYFERMQNRIEQLPNLSDEEKTELDTEVQAVITNLQTLKTQIDGTATGDEDTLKSLAQQVLELFKSKRTLVWDIVKGIHEHHVTNVLTRAHERLAAITSRLDEFTADGKDVSSLIALADQAQTALSAAQDSVTAGEYRQALESIKQAYTLFRQIIQGAKDL